MRRERSKHGLGGRTGDVGGRQRDAEAVEQQAFSDTRMVSSTLPPYAPPSPHSSINP